MYTRQQEGGPHTQYAKHGIEQYVSDAYSVANHHNQQEDQTDHQLHDGNIGSVEECNDEYCAKIIYNSQGG
ncbi:hypothetical protein D3C86_1715880 [compost metagenome]